MDYKDIILEKGFINCKDLLKNKNKKVILLSCGPSIEEYKDVFLNLLDKDYIIVTIKTANIYTNGREDFFFYNENLHTRGRKYINYKCDNKVIKVFCRNYYETVYVKLKITHDIHFCIKYNDSRFMIENDDFKFEKSDIKNKIYYNVDGFFPIYLKAIMFFNYLGVKEYDIFGVNWYEEDLKCQRKHYTDRIGNKLLFDNLTGSFYSNIFLKDLINKEKLKLRLFSNYSQMDICIPRINIYNEVFYQKSNYFYKCLNILKEKEKFNKNYDIIAKLCTKSKYYNKIWYKTLILMISNIDNYRYENLNQINNNYRDILFEIGSLIGM